MGGRLLDRVEVVVLGWYGSEKRVVMGRTSWAMGGKPVGGARPSWCILGRAPIFLALGGGSGASLGPPCPLVSASRRMVSWFGLWSKTGLGATGGLTEVNLEGVDRAVPEWWEGLAPRSTVNKRTAASTSQFTPETNEKWRLVNRQSIKWLFSTIYKQRSPQFFTVTLNVPGDLFSSEMMYLRIHQRVAKNTQVEWNMLSHCTTMLSHTYSVGHVLPRRDQPVYGRWIQPTSLPPCCTWSESKPFSIEDPIVS